ncbi:MAG TPA: phosphoenolpyruvate carboxylase [Steroidobacteraceae bacterium]|jgi:phosphoenolpyruvate carboxylase|nr:phosphoenolpyruvate carboxylase [Steroidobacteraceae bacterium]
MRRSVSRSDIHFPPKHEALREDVHALGALVGEILREQGGQQLFELVELDRHAAIRRRDGDDEAALELAASVRDRPPALARDLVRAFSMWFQAVNLAEKVHRIRRRREYFRQDSGRPQPSGVEDGIASLRARGLPFEEVLALLGSLRIEPVFAAHSMESTRRTLLRKQQRIAQHLLDRLDPMLTPQDARSLWSSIRVELTTAWQTEELPRERLTVGDEREQVLFYLLEILYRVVPAFYEEITQALEKHYGVPADSIELPAILRFGSWVGGDMDGNPDVHAKTIRETLARQQQVILNSYFEDCRKLSQRLSQSAGRIAVSAELAQRVEDYMTLAPSARSVTPARHDRMPYRVFLAQIGERLRLTYEGRANGYESARQFRDDVRLIAASLAANKGANAGLFYIRRFLHRIDTFGFHLASLDVRQHAGVLHEIIASGNDDPGWLGRSREERRQLLATMLEKDAGPRVELDALGKRNLAVFEAFAQARHRYGPQAVGYFIVSGARGADDVLAALALARWASVYDKRTGQVALDIAPQFESLESLERCGDILRELLAEPVYRRHLAAHDRRQCVLLGYSDSNKEGGLCASRYAIHQAQRALARLPDGERYLVFHARGGSIARGGGRIDALVKSAPAGAINGTLRLREQGETVKQGYGLRPIAMRTLERAFNALSLATVTSREAAAQSPGTARDSTAHLECAATLADASREAYRRLVYGDGAFHGYFRAVTPIDVIERMQVGSRPVHREEGRSIEGLLPVPWVFAWTQTRHMLPGWFGAGTGLAAAIARHGAERMRAAYAEWFFLRSLIDDVEAMLARADLRIATAYDVLVPEPLRRFSAEIRAEYERARERVLWLKGSTELLDGEPTLQRSIRLRNPYIDPMNLMQVDLLQRWRAGGRGDRDLFEALLTSAGGIAQGLQSIA